MAPHLRSPLLIGVLLLVAGCNPAPAVAPDGDAPLDDGGVRRDSGVGGGDGGGSVVDAGPACVPTGDELCNGEDDDCNGSTDEGTSVELGCAELEVCETGACTCAGLVCGGTCVEPASDRNHCGDCDSPCDMSCVDGGCAEIHSIAPGGGHTCVLLQDGAGVWCWGDIGEGVPGGATGAIAMGNVPYAVPGTEGAVALTSGRNHSCAVYDDGAVRCWGRGANGVLGNGDTANSWVPVDTGLTGMIGVDSRADHACAWNEAGEVYCWGKNDGGQLGDGTFDNRPSPVRVGGATTFTDVATGSTHTCGLTTTGLLSCWGSGVNGALGDGNTASHNATAPTTVAGLSSVTRLAVGAAHTCVIGLGATGAGLYCFGRNHQAQVGVPSSTAAVGSPTEIAVAEVPTLGGIRALSIVAGNVSTCLYAGSQRPVCWGANASRERGDGTDDGATHQHREVVDGVDFTGLSGGMVHYCALRTEDGRARAYCWGSNFKYQLGFGAPEMNENRPGAVLYR